MAFELINDYKYPYANTYSGYAEQCFFSFSLGPEQLPGTGWFADLAINSFADEVEAQGARMLELRVYRDTAPTWSTPYFVEAVCTASPVPWPLIIGSVLVIVFLFAVSFVIEQINTLWYGPQNGGNGVPAMGSIISLMVIVMIMSMILPMMSGITEEPKRLTYEEEE